MRKVVAAAFLSLDGIMQAPGGPDEDPTGDFTLGGWTVNYWDEMMGATMDKTFGDPFDLLLGRKTYEIFAAHWPYVDENDPIGTRFAAVTKYVATSSTSPLTWQNSVILNGDVAAEVKKLKESDGPILLTQGSSDIIQTLLSADLIDEFRLLTFPLVLGHGKRLFGKGAIPAALKLTDTKVSTTGVVLSTYVRDGKIEPGTFALEQPTAAEIERRARMAREG
ncbi:dihydrofolate reductase family protein [Pararhizobium sp. BT-229]|uniref:dihydrofolate reductase family protein n=1 Tax=Pararhizobium sp. BT-229 TaxID=2986923 RepID=UPI0021F74DC6|nr:dihydrofolate reductase family protein [Pararhizobium sp. BT-229]MCV9963311.1 dihydrofolate reductase family protein [Pararhizobium sp. BT-229]